VTEPGARDWWLVFEPVHAVVYFDDGCRDSMADIGMRGFWMGYFAGRAAPLGPIGPDVVAAMFFTFHPDMVRRALPDAWRLAGPVEGLWHGCTCLREYRGGGHVAALTASGLDGAEALVLFAASEGLPPGLLRPARGWSEGEWAAAGDRLRTRGLVDAAGISPEGARLRHSVGAMTDHQAGPPLAALDDGQRRELLDAVGPVTAAVHASGVIPYPNPMGLPAPMGR